MYHTILVPLDGSKRAEAILPHVENLAQHYDAKVIFLEVVGLVPMAIEPEGTTTIAFQQQEFKRRAEQARSYLTTLQGEFREKGIDSKVIVVFGPVVREIINAAEREGADLIAIASHGRSGLPQVFYGSVAAGVLHSVDRPLLVVRS